ncbi:restriction endonuclease subunit S [Vibrio syngnathi]|uniref:EcoKI restriction-modification system protein HsdS n=1 Tax=Vibrio syngnathi TaxID=3034029 RepID=A0AA34XPV0_9VIBR|nr:restriction endonuclease subunit S [Vibrio syngnathi]ARP39574.1 EcoKI restriction-modification system protein HsdS [Vibrio syngnathi]
MSNLKKYRFCELYTMSSGISSTKEQAGHGSPFLSFSTVFKNYFVPDELNDLMATSEKEKETYSIKNGDIFLTRTSEVVDELAMSCVATKDYPNAAFSGFVKRLRPTQSDITYSKFMAFYLRSPMFRKTMTNNAVMTLRASLNEAIFSYLDLLLPEFDEQVKVGDLLCLLNEKIELNNRIDTELEAMLKTLYDYWFVQFDFPDTNGKPYKASGGKMVFNETLKREIPEGWEVCELGEHITFSRGISYRSKDIAETGTPLLNLNSFLLSGRFKLNGTKYFSGSYKLDKLCNTGDLVIAITDVTRNADIIGKGFIIPDAFEEKRALISCDVALVKSSYFGNTYLERLFNSDYYHNYIKHFASGTLVLHLDLKGVNWYKTELPPQYLINRFEELSKPILQRRDIVVQENKKLVELRDWLLPMLMNGQVTVK